jgi:replicative DNA helicase
MSVEPVVLPNARESEAEVLGYLLGSPPDATGVVELLRPDLFHDGGHRAVFDAVVALLDRDEGVDLSLVVDEMRRRGTIDQVRNGALGVERLFADALAIGSTVPTHVERIVDAHARRRFVHDASEAMRAAVSGNGDWRALARRMEELPDAPTSRASTVPGGDWVLDAPTDVPAVWGSGERVAWSVGEPAILVGPPGVGKTTIAQDLMLAMTGVRPGPVLGLRVRPVERPILYVAADRPTQAQRSMRRMLGSAFREALNARLLVHRGPLPTLLTEDPRALQRYAERLGVGTVVLDSLKDVAADITKDEGGNAINLALQTLVASGIEALVLHHQRKGAAGEARKPRGLDDVYGSALITAGAGSVLLAWGDAGDPIVELSHLKQPAVDVGPLEVAIDHDAGSVSLVEGKDALSILRSMPSGIEVRPMAVRLYGSDGRKEVEKARRKLNALRDDGLAFLRDGPDGGPGTYFATPPDAERLL